jgi:Xaa-Pro aminopeptidase
MKIEIVKKRREKLSEEIKNNELVIIFAATESCETEPFYQDNNFLYFTGLNIPKAIFTINKVKEKSVETLFIERGIPEREVWDGKKMTTKEAFKFSGIKNVKFLDEFDLNIFSLLFGAEKCYVNYNFKLLDSPLDRKLEFIKKVRERFPKIIFENAIEVIRPLRAIKSSWEIKQLQKAIEITNNGILSIFKNTKTGMYEYEAEAFLRYEMYRNGLKRFGFQPIVAGGKNATILHYISNVCKIKKGDLLLLDVGVSYNNYSADISRTYPISGKFNKRQKDVYQAVLNIQKEIIAMIKPGVSMTELNKKTTDLIIAALKKLKLIKKDSEYKKYYMHSVSHHLGMDTHDIVPRDSVLKVGNVITVEPGIYIPEENIGVRIEDDVLVTKTGYRVLSKAIPKEIDELETILDEE